MNNQRNPYNIPFQGIIIFLLALIIGFGVTYIILDIVSEDIEGQNQAHFDNGTALGYNQAHIDIFETVSFCQPFPVTFQNLSYNLIAMECLNLSGAGR